jgi:hypothetical protein
MKWFWGQAAAAAMLFGGGMGLFCLLAPRLPPKPLAVVIAAAGAAGLSFAAFMSILTETMAWMRASSLARPKLGLPEAAPSSLAISAVLLVLSVGAVVWHPSDPITYAVSAGAAHNVWRHVRAVRARAA